MHYTRDVYAFIAMINRSEIIRDEIYTYQMKIDNNLF